MRARWRGTRTPATPFDLEDVASHASVRFCPPPSRGPCPRAPLCWTRRDATASDATATIELHTGNPLVPTRVHAGREIRDRAIAFIVGPFRVPTNPSATVRSSRAGPVRRRDVRLDRRRSDRERRDCEPTKAVARIARRPPRSRVGARTRSRAGRAGRSLDAPKQGARECGIALTVHRELSPKLGGTSSRRRACVYG
jgi:hypothetical protein